ncbi:MAG: hypothetical protein J6Q65_05200, partial [Lentisphaeria bacterium]|nr:hypothetical protein [Lentisphaeria bacterium]
MPQTRVPSCSVTTGSPQARLAAVHPCSSASSAKARITKSLHPGRSAESSCTSSCVVSGPTLAS